MRTFFAIGLLLVSIIVFWPNTSWTQSSKSSQTCEAKDTNFSGILKDVEWSESGDICSILFVSDDGKETTLDMYVGNMEIESKYDDNIGKRFKGIYRTYQKVQNGSCVADEDREFGDYYIKFE